MAKKDKSNNNDKNQKIRWNGYQGHAGGQGWEVKLNINTETIMASARVSLKEINKERM